MIINHNIAALNTLNHLNAANNAQSKAMQKLSSGLRINGAADDAAGLAISEKMRSQIRGLNQATSNAQDASSLAQTAEGALNETTDILQRMRELATQASNDTNTADDREQIQKEMNQLTSEINRIGNTTEFNTQKLLDGSKSANTTQPAQPAQPAQGAEAETGGQTAGQGFKFQIGANENQSITLEINDMRSVALGISSKTSGTGFTSSQTVTNGTNNAAEEYALDVSSADNASNAITKIDKAIKKVSTERANLGAFENRLEHTVNNLTTSSENLTSAESRIRDVDYALAA